MAYEYGGDQATVLPSNTEAMVHFSDQFARREQERRARDAANQKAEQDRQIRLQKYIGDRLNAKDFSPVLDDDLKSSMSEIQKKIKGGESEINVMGMTDQLASGLAMKSAKIKSSEAKQAARIAELSKEDPNLDATALANIASINFHKKKDADGNWVRKSADEMDDDKDYVGDAYKDHWFELYSPKNSAHALTKAIDEEKLQEIDIPTSYNDNGSLKKLGVKGKVPAGLVGFSTDEKGQPAYEVYHNNYRLPGTNYDFVDKDGNTVKVASEPIFNKYYQGAIGADIERQVRTQLENTKDFNGSGVSMFSPESDYADMLRKKLLYEKLQESTKGKFILNSDEDKSLEKRKAQETLNISKQNLELSRQDNQLAREKFNYEKSKANGKNPTVSDITPLTVSIGQTAGKDYTFNDGKGGTITKRFVLESDIDGEDLKMITGNKYDENGKLKEKVIDPATINLPGKPGAVGYYVTGNGDWLGANGKIIKKERVADAQLKYYSKDDLPVTSKGIRSSIKTIVNKVKSAVTPSKPASTAQGKIR